MRRIATVLAALLVALVVVLPANAAEASPGGCKAFGQNVAGLATGLGAEFGATASFVASSEPQAFPNLVVKPEQAQLCGDG